MGSSRRYISENINQSNHSDATCGGKYYLQIYISHVISVLPRPFSKGGTPCRVLMTPCLFQEAEMTPCLFLVTPCYNFYFAPNVTVRGNWRGKYACVSLFYSTAFVIVIRLV